MNDKYYKIAVYAICKDEPKEFFDRWFPSMKEADYIVILDTGSTNGTMELLEKYKNEFESNGENCKIIYDQKVISPWRFDTARNESLLLCPEDTDIFVSTDIDEVLEPGWAKVLRDNWDDTKYDRVSYRYTWSHLENGDPARIFDYDKIHGKGLWWIFPVHECLCYKSNLSNKFDQSRYIDLTDKIMLHHYPDKNKSRGSYLGLLELRAKEYPEDTFGLIYLAHEYYYRGRYEEGIETLDNIINRPDFNSFAPVERASCYLFKGDAYRELKQYGLAMDNFNKAIEIDPTLREPYLRMASMFIEMKQYGIAIDLAKQAIKNGVRHYSWIEKDGSWSVDPWDILAIASFYYGKKRDSIAYAYKAYEYDSGSERLKKNLDIILQNCTENELIL